MRLRRMSIRWRLTWAYSIGIIVALFLVGALVWWQMSDTLMRGLEMSLATQSNATLTSLENQGQVGIQDSDQAAPDVWTVLFDASSQRLDASRGAPPGVPAVPGTYAVGGHEYLLRVDTAQGGTIVVTGTDLAPVSESQAALARILLGVGLSVGVASLIAGWLLASRALRPIDRLITEAESLGPGDLDRRLAHAGQIDEVGRLTLTLNSMLDRIADSVARQRLFVALASHELRTPLAALRAELDLVDRDGNATIDEYRKAVREAQADAVRLTTLTASMLELATAAEEAQQLIRAPVAVSAAISSAVRAVADMADQRGATVSVDAPHTIVWIDRTRVEQALINLLSNAIIHSPTPAQVEVRGELSGPQAEWLTLTVLDRGPGFGQNDPNEMFTPFRRGSGTHATGSGLGLALVAATARAHGGLASAAARPGGGATVWLTIRSGDAGVRDVGPRVEAKLRSAVSSR